MELLVTCNQGLESILKKEIEKLGYKITKSSDRLVYFKGDDLAIIKMNLWSRVGNKVYVLLKKGHVGCFEDLFQIVHSINWKDLINQDQPIIVQASSIKSQLESVPSIQSITKKAIVKKILGGEGVLYEDKVQDDLEVQIVIDNNECFVLLNTSGASLHQRGYRLYNYDAPIKETLAAGIIGLATWKYSLPFFDAFCGSGTFVIEAAMIAKNIAPGLLRKFSFESFAWMNKEMFSKAKIEAKEQIFTDKVHEIYGFDINPRAVEISKLNAQIAGVDNYIKFEQKDYFDIDVDFLKNKTMISNPPYGMRLEDEDVGIIHKQLIDDFENNTDFFGGFITGFEPAHKIIDPNLRKLRKLYNGGQKCYFFKSLK